MRKKFQVSMLIFLFIISSLTLGSQNAFPSRAAETPSSIPSQAPSQALYAEAIKVFEDFVVQQMPFDGVPGLSVAFMKDDFVWAKGFGYADLENMVPAKPETSYRLASVSKTLTAISVLQLVEEGKIDLDAEVQTYVPYFPKKKWPITVRQLLGHLGGISHYKNLDNESHIKEPKNTRQAIAIFQDFDLVAEPGTRYNYSSYGYNLLGAVIEVASGESYGEYLREHIFEPLGMENSRMDNPLDLIPNRASGYRMTEGRLENSEFVDISSRFAAGGTRSTVVDLIKFASAIIEGKLLGEDTRRMMFSSMAQKNGLFTWYGMGWSVQPWNGHFQACHGGSQPETRTHLLIFPRDRVAIAIAVNLEEFNLMPYVTRLANLILDEDLNSFAYASTREMQLIYGACYQTFTYGMSSYDWNRGSLSKSRDDVEKAFDYFNRYVSQKTLQRDFEEARKRIQAGVHLEGNQALTKVGSFMAATLEKDGGREKFLRYRKAGPIAFFDDYIKLNEKRAGAKKIPSFKEDFSRLIKSWRKDWEATWTEDVRRLVITPQTDFDQLGAAFKKTFQGASLCRDFSADLVRIAQLFFERNLPEKTFQILNLSRELYPSSPMSYASLANFYIWLGNAQAAREFFNKAFSMDSSHPMISTDQFISTGGRLARAEKVKEALALARIALELYPQEARLYAQLGELYIQSGEKEKAIENFRKALEINPSLEIAKENLRALEK